MIISLERLNGGCYMGGGTNKKDLLLVSSSSPNSTGIKLMVIRLQMFKVIESLITE